MAFTATATFSFGESQTGLSDLTVQPLTTAHIATGSPVTGTFVEIGRGVYGWSGSVPDDTAWLKGYRTGDTTVFSIDDARLAYLDAPVSEAGGSGTVDEDAIAQAVADEIEARGVEFSITFTTPVLEDGTLDLVAGDAYEDDRAIISTITGYTGPSVDAATLSLRLMLASDYRADGSNAAAALTVDGTATQDGTTVIATFELEAAETALLATMRGSEGTTRYIAQIVYPTASVTLWHGKANVRRRIGAMAP